MKTRNCPAPIRLRLSPIVASLVFVALVLMPRQTPAQSTYTPYTFTTLAGGGGYSTNVPGSITRLGLLTVAVDTR